MKVYCWGCLYYQWYDPTAATKFQREECIFPKNVPKEVIVDSYLQRTTDIVLSKPDEINKNNNCKWWEKKE